MIEAEPIEMEVALGRPGVLGIHQIADMRVVQGQGAGFPNVSFPDGGLAWPGECQVPGN